LQEALISYDNIAIFCSRRLPPALKSSCDYPTL
jgi:hypothetical protein